jgi:hypothetical protein
MEKDGKGILIAGLLRGRQIHRLPPFGEHLPGPCATKRSSSSGTGMGAIGLTLSPHGVRCRAGETRSRSGPSKGPSPFPHILFLEPGPRTILLPLGRAQAAMRITKTALEKCRWSLLNPKDGLSRDAKSSITPASCPGPCRHPSAGRPFQVPWRK